jgi:serine/threonine protein kinase
MASTSSFMLDSQERQTLDYFRRSEVPVELTSQVFSSDAADDDQSTGPAWFKLLEIIAFHNIPIVSDADLTTIRAQGGESSIREGTFGSVKRAKWRPHHSSAQTPEVVAMKEFNVAKTAESTTERRSMYLRQIRDVMFEIEIMGRCNHPNLVKLRAVAFKETEDNLTSPLLIMEAADDVYADLEVWCQRDARPSFATILEITSGIAKGLNMLHCLGVIHADLKPRNVLMFKDGDTWRPKLADFGLSGITISSDAPRGGTRRWNAPECLPGTPKDLQAFATKPCRDIYAFGLLVAYMLLQGQELFAAYDGDVDAFKLSNADEVSSYPLSLVSKHRNDRNKKPPPVFGKLFNSTLRRHPEDRFTTMVQVLPILDKSTSQTKGQVTTNQIYEIL